MATGLPPWLRGPDVLGAMQAGAHVGLQGRAQDIQQAEAADRLRLAYDQLAKQEEQNMILAQQHGDAAAALRQYRQGLLAHQKAQDTAANRRADISEKRMEATDALRQAHDSATQAYQNKRLEQFDTAEERQRENLERLKGQYGTPKTPSAASYLSTVSSLSKALEEPGVSDSEKQRIRVLKNEAQTKANELLGLTAEKVVTQHMPGWFGAKPPTTNWVPSSASSPMATPPVNAADALTASPPQQPITQPNRVRVRNKKTGKLGWGIGDEIPDDYEVVPPEEQ
jgi:hypothetical protein